jgi:aspartyl-tRNA(Asn)/glutamyl-tRNA(Gln) amidotransferase subunit C
MALVGAAGRDALVATPWLRRQKRVCYSLHLVDRWIWPAVRGAAMSVDNATVRRIARLARIAVADDEIEHLKGELNAMLAFVEQLSEVDIAGVEPMTSVMPMKMRERPDQVTDGGIAAEILANAPARQDDFFMVPRVVE